jgi:glycosyltransferase involved in cell wall biosynthesis
MMVFLIAPIIIMAYFAYVLWLMLHEKAGYVDAVEQPVEQISIIYLSQNGDRYLEEKIAFLLDELSAFEESELIVIDDNSDDSTDKIFRKFNSEQLLVIQKTHKQGIPHSMNLGIQHARFEHVVFCDQRQNLEKGIVKKLVEPLKYQQVGAVSSCISCVDKSKGFSLLRAHENFIKQLEGRTGNLMGVYGPLYAIKKSCYHNIPERIILDDLYLTLSVLSTKQVVFQEDCKIYDDSLDFLYDYKRARRYLSGFFQLLGHKELLSGLSPRQKLMLFWHKYFRILIPIALAFSYLMMGLKSSGHPYVFILFVLLTFLSIVFLTPLHLNQSHQLRNIFRFVMFYSVGILDLFVSRIFTNHKAS